jgi:peptide/nickel transport system permease protein
MLSQIEYILKRTGYAVITLFVVSVVIFIFTQLLPGNAAELSLGQFGTEQDIQELEESMGLDRPVYIQYLDWLYGLITGNLGNSLFWGTPVQELIVSRGINSLYLTVSSLALMTIISVPLGIIAAVKQGTYTDTVLSGLSNVAISIPDFIWATFFVYTFAGPVYNILPASGFIAPTENIVGSLQHLLLPSLTLAMVTVAHVMRQTRRGMIEALNSDYVRLARLKGISEKSVVIKHAFRNGILPAITVISFTFGWMMGGLVIVEEVFAYPGLGRLAVNAIQNRDIPVIQTAILVLATAYIFGNTIADIMYTVLDPRIQYGD